MQLVSSAKWTLLLLSGPLEPEQPQDEKDNDWLSPGYTLLIEPLDRLSPYRQLIDCLFEEEYVQPRAIICKQALSI